MPEKVVLVIFGASGDLARRKLVPAIFSLTCEGFLSPSDIFIVGFARTPLREEDFRNELFKGIENYSRITTSQCKLWPNLSDRVIYHRGDYRNLESYKRLKELLNQIETKNGISRNHHIFYLATPPLLYQDIIDALGLSGLTKKDNDFPKVILDLVTLSLNPYGTEII
jgi:glucose-6-phosphate 1-dehydrogenase